MFNKIKLFFNRKEDQTRVIYKNIFQSFGLKAVSIVLSLIIVPLTINYVSPEEYGIWLSLSSIVQWMSYFDIGLGHGLRNRFAESRATGDGNEKKYVSTAYVVIALIFLSVFAIFAVINQYLNWNSILNVEQISNTELRDIMFILVGFFSLAIVFRVANSVLLGDQKTSVVAAITVLEQIVSLGLIFLLTKYSESSLLKLAFVSAATPCIVLLFVSMYIYRRRGIFNYCRPSFRHVDFSLVSNLLNLGTKFFIIQISLLLIFQIVNVILLRNCGAVAVSHYQLSYKYFSMLYMITTIILTPYWSAYTAAYTRGDYVWMRNEYRKLRMMSVITIPVLGLMILLAPIFFKLWIGDSIVVPIGLHVGMALYICSMIYASISMYLLNGIGKISLQLIIYIAFAIISIPIMNILSNGFGAYGILFFLSIVYLCQGTIGCIQINKILSQSAKGIWAK